MPLSKATNKPKTGQLKPVPKDVKPKATPDYFNKKVKVEKVYRAKPLAVNMQDQQGR